MDRILCNTNFKVRAENLECNGTRRVIVAAAAAKETKNQRDATM